MRTALLSAVTHDLRTPLASAMAAVLSLQDKEVEFSESDRDNLLATAHQSLARLERLISNLLDTSRLQAGVMGIKSRVVGVEELLPGAIDDIGAE
ncbi:MAG: histidine kinase dimerization/phospho-acceptor domain-containing protein, partial [Dermatophilaceae bacterium]